MNAIMWVVTGLYVVQSGIYSYAGNTPQAVVLAGYAFANLGLIWSTHG